MAATATATTHPAAGADSVIVAIQDDRGECRTFKLQGRGPFIIGRHSEATIQLDSELVSRQHVVVRVGAKLLVEDLSTNGTIVGKTLLKKRQMEVPLGTPIGVGGFTLHFSLRGSSGHNSGLEVVPAAPPPPPAPRSARGTHDSAEIRRTIHRRLLEHLDLVQTNAKNLDDPSFRPRVLAGLRLIVQELAAELPPGTDPATLVGEMADEVLGLGPLENLIKDPTVTEVMVIDANTIYVERSGRLELAPSRFTDDDRVRAAIERIITPLGRRIDESSPLVDARLKDGSRVNAIIKPLALRGSCITIRKFARVPLTVENLVGFGTMTDGMARFLKRTVISKKNIVISGGTGSGKTTLLNVLSSAIPADERIITIEDAAELRLAQPHVVALETRPSNMEGKGQYTIRDLVKNALRMRPDRIVVGECRGGEALDMLQAMNTGHDGSLTTTHANSPEEAARRLETLALMAGLDVPPKAIREQIANSIHLIVQQARLSDGSRKITAITEVVGLDPNGEVDMRDIFVFARTGTGPDGKVIGEFRATGYLPSFLSDFIVGNLVKPGEPYL
jgi:pilus assembly protein CpaF